MLRIWICLDLRMCKVILDRKMNSSVFLLVVLTCRMIEGFQSSLVTTIPISNATSSLRADNQSTVTMSLLTSDPGINPNGNNVNNVIIFSVVGVFMLVVFSVVLFTLIFCLRLKMSTAYERSSDRAIRNPMYDDKRYPSRSSHIESGGFDPHSGGFDPPTSNPPGFDPPGFDPPSGPPIGPPYGSINILPPTETSPVYSNPVRFPNRFLRRNANDAQKRRELNASHSSVEARYERQSGHHSSIEYDEPYTVHSLQARKPFLYESLSWGTYVPTEEQRKSLVEGSVPESLSFENETGGANVFFQQSDIYWKPASNSASLYEQLARNKYREISREQIQTTGHLGSGNFGNVDCGLWYSPVGVIQVAVKVLKEKASEKDKVKFLQEVAINGQFHHRNVVKLLGVVTLSEPVMMVLELLANGDLRNYLIKSRPVPGEMVLPEVSHMLLKFCQQISSGMEYLSRKAFVHRDLAARNILVAEDKTCKIGDFGLARDLENEQYYVSHGGQVPVKWTAPEALHYKKYSTASDVWSFGVVMYEIWSLGHKPFGGCKNAEAIKMIDEGKRLHPPPGCPRAIYSLMIKCWHPKKEFRPSFLFLLQSLNEISPTEVIELDDDGSGLTQESILGGPLEKGKNLHQDLNQTYIGQHFMYLYRDTS